MEQIDYTILTDTEKAYGADKVVRISPAEGALYTQDDESSIILYYYK